LKRKVGIPVQIGEDLNTFVAGVLNRTCFWLCQPSFGYVTTAFIL